MKRERRRRTEARPQRSCGTFLFPCDLWVCVHVTAELVMLSAGLEPFPVGAQLAGDFFAELFSGSLRFQRVGIGPTSRGPDPSDENAAGPGSFRVRISIKWRHSLYEARDQPNMDAKTTNADW